MLSCAKKLGAVAVFASSVDVGANDAGSVVVDVKLDATKHGGGLSDFKTQIAGKIPDMRTMFASMIQTGVQKTVPPANVLVSWADAAWGRQLGATDRQLVGGEVKPTVHFALTKLLAVDRTAVENFLKNGTETAKAVAPIETAVLAATGYTVSAVTFAAQNKFATQKLDAHLKLTTNSADGADFVSKFTNGAAMQTTYKTELAKLINAAGLSLARPVVPAQILTITAATAGSDPLINFTLGRLVGDDASKLTAFFQTGAGTGTLEYDTVGDIKAARTALIGAIAAVVQTGHDVTAVTVKTNSANGVQETDGVQLDVLTPTTTTTSTNTTSTNTTSTNTTSTTKATSSAAFKAQVAAIVMGPLALWAWCF